MLAAQEFGELLNDYSYNFYSGVPCSFLKDLINYAINDQEFIMAANEGDALAICAGAHLGGRKTVFLCQNSGLANAVSSLTSLNYTFQIPVLGFVSLRGEPGLKDEPQHELMGTITSELLSTMKIPHEVLSTDITEAKKQLAKADQCIKENKSFFFIVKKKTFMPVKLLTQEYFPRERKSLASKVYEAKHKRLEVLSTLKDIANQENLILLATTGVTGRELFELGDTPNQFYMVGSMGCISSIGLGLAIAQPDRKIVAIDGDGALMMRLGSLTTNAYYQPSNLYHLLLDNNLHESTGGQKTVAANVDFKQIAAGAGYEVVDSLENMTALNESIAKWLATPSLTFGDMKIKSGTKDDLGRPTVTPIDVKERLIRYIKEQGESMR